MKAITEQGLNHLICQVAGGQVPDPPPSLDTPLEHEHLDSLACLELAACLSRDFGYRVSDDAITGQTTRREILALSPEVAQA